MKRAVIIGQNFRRMRKDLKLSQEYMADKLGISFQQVQKYEKGDNRISADTLYELRRIFGCRYEDFFDGLDARDINGNYRQKMLKLFSEKMNQILKEIAV